MVRAGRTALDAGAARRFAGLMHPGASDLPALRRLALLRLEGRSRNDAAVLALDSRLEADPWVGPLLRGAVRTDATGAVASLHPYQKWRGAHWRLVALGELAVDVRVPGASGPIRAAFDAVMGWLGSPVRRRRAGPVNGLVRMCAGMEGNALWAACRLGLGADPRAAALVERLVAWQWPDGGWNCDPRPAASHSSLHETWIPLRGLAAYGGSGTTELEARAVEAAARAADFLLRHRVVERERDGGLIDPAFARPRWPPYWHYDLLAGLDALREADPRLLVDPRAAPALARLDSLRGRDELWHPGGRWWRAPGSVGANVELVDWDVEGESAMLTLRALAIRDAVDSAFQAMPHERQRANRAPPDSSPSGPRPATRVRDA